MSGDRLDRRTAIKGIGGLLAGGTIPAIGAAAGTSKDSGQQSSDKESSDSQPEIDVELEPELDIENDRVVVTDDGGDSVQPSAEQFNPADSEVEFDSGTIAGILNNGIERGDLNVFKESGTVMVESTVSSKSSTSSTTQTQPRLSSASCGQNSLNWRFGLGRTMWINMDHSLTDQVAFYLNMGAGVSAAVGAVLGATVGPVPAAVFGVIAAALTMVATLLTHTDNGCGVKITFRKTIYGTTTADISPQ